MVNVRKLIRGECPSAPGPMTDVGLLALRVTAGGLMAGHGAQKLFGAFGGGGLEGTGGWLDSIGMRPGKRWATLAGLSEFGGGMLTALGVGGPLGPLAIQGAMATAARKVHWNKPIWSTAGGAELPAINSAIGVALAFAGPGRYSLDRALGIRVPLAVTGLAVAGVAAGVILADRQSPPAQPDDAESTTTAAADEAPEEGEDRVIATQPVADYRPETGDTVPEDEVPMPPSDAQTSGEDAGGGS